MQSAHRQRLLHSLKEAGRQLGALENEWDDRVIPARAECPSQLTLTPTYPTREAHRHLKALVRQVNSRHSFLRAHGHSLADVEGFSLDLFIQRSVGHFISTETRETRAKRTLIKAEMLIFAVLDWLEQEENLLQEEIRTFQTFQRRETNAKHQENLEMLARLVDSADELAVPPADDIALEVKIMRLHDRIAQIRSVLERDEGTILEFLRLLDRLEIRIPRQKKITEFFDRV